MRPRAPATALIEQNDAIVFRIKIAPHRRTTAATWSSVKHNHWDAVTSSALLDIDPVPVANVHHPLIEWVDRRIEKL